ncbi:hypothetical protein FKW77_004774 [Venturia effusa]|uniref:SANT domain-containing protein n=1 Tax=Venturia effusa TaxID=50376 RepID=A0A517L5C1_9PEZI|nr:hypothetical protein FKW77_004774 [Venturia effusa]
MASGKRDDEEDSSDGSEYVPKATPSHKQKETSVGWSQRREESAEESSTSTLKSTSSRSNPRKYIRLKGCYNDEYRKLLNTAISEAVNISVDDDSETVNPMLNLPPSELGGTKWTADEKRIFFRAVARYGRDDLPRIASSLHSKTEPEVKSYLELLQKMMLQNAKSEHRGLRSASDEMRIATEVSDECLEELDTCADALAWYQFTWEAKQEQKAHGKFWLLNRELADEITMTLDIKESEEVASRCPSESGDSLQSDSAMSSPSSEIRESMSRSGSPGVFKPVPAAEFLNLANFIELSETIFMNSKDPDWDWRSFRDLGKPDKSHSKLSRAEESPAIFRTAFDDLHRLTVSLTKRIMHAALFQATSRLRARDNIERPLARDPRVGKRDVLAALDILNLKRSSFEHWATLPRRHKVDWVFQTDPSNRFKNRQVTAAEAENYLRHEGRIDHSKADELFQADLAASREQPPSQDSDSESVASSEDVPATLGHETCDVSYDQYLELLDLQTSRTQEQQIWDLLGKDAPSGANLSDAVEAKPPKTIPTIEQGTSSFADWRAWTERRAEWEADESGMSEDEAGESGNDSSATDRGVSLSWISVPQTALARELGADSTVEPERTASGALEENGGRSTINTYEGTKRKRTHTTANPPTAYDMDIPFRKRHEEHSPAEMEAAQGFLGDEPAWVTQDVLAGGDEQESNRSPSPAQSFYEAQGQHFDDSE